MTGEERLAAGRLIIAIDGPSGAGKSTITRMLADRLGYLAIDTGAMYRAVALAVKRKGIPADDEPALAALCENLSITFARESADCPVLLNGEDVSGQIRTPEISLLTSRVSARKVVRDMLRISQQRIGAEGGVILEGRDIGTVVFPDADVKFFLSASVEARGERRYRELREKGMDVTLEATVAEVAQRDEQDSCREHAPLCQAHDAVVIDSTTLTILQVLQFMEETIGERIAVGAARVARGER